MFINLCSVLLFIIHGVEGLSLTQSQKVFVKQKGKTVSFKCEVSDLGSNNFVHWYHKKDGETLKRLLYISYAGTATGEATDFVSEKIGNSYGIKLKEIKEEHSGMYYCAVWEGDRKIFGSGTRLYVTEPGKDNVKTPELSGYLNKATDKPVALCQARDMFPDLVSFKWEKKSNNEDWSEVPKEQIVEQSHNEDPVTSMVVPNTVEDNTYRCTVTHEGNTKNPSPIIIEKTEKKQPGNKTPDTPDPTCPPSTEKTPISQESDNPEKKQSLQLFVYGYAVMLMKNVLYFIVVFIVLLKRKAGKKEERS